MPLHSRDSPRRVRSRFRRPYRRKLGVGPGSTLEWHEEGEKIVVRRVGRFTSADLHEALFPSPPKRRSLDGLKAGLRSHAKRRHARR